MNKSGNPPICIFAVCLLEYIKNLWIKNNPVVHIQVKQKCSEYNALNSRSISLICKLLGHVTGAIMTKAECRFISSLTRVL